MELLTQSFIFLFIALAAWQVGLLFARIGLPNITGYLLVGFLAGPFILKLLPENSGTTLRYVEEISLAVIAFVAGNELYWKEIRPRLRSISLITGGVIIAAAVLVGVALFFLVDLVPLTQGLGTSARLSIAILGATVLLALSPASTIAVIVEARAKGNYTRTILGVTVSMDVAIIFLFAIAVAVVGALIGGSQISPSFLLLLVLDLGAAIVLGFLVGKALEYALTARLPQWVKIAIVLGLGYLVFVGSRLLADFSHDNLPFEIHIEPILVAMVAGFGITNFSPRRDEFGEILHDIGPAVYVAFFTLTGLLLQLDVLLATWPIALALFAIRMVGVFIGSYAGGRLAGEPAQFNRLAWMGLITQAGIALGLAREVALEFPEFGEAFATLVISVVVLSVFIGPVLLKSALKRTGEATLPGEAAADRTRDAVIVGIEAQSRELARQLQREGWTVTLADTDREHVAQLDPTQLSGHYVPAVSKQSLTGLITNHTDAVVAMLEDDESNRVVLETAYAEGVHRLVVRPADLANTAEFVSLGALVIDPASAMVTMLDQAVRAPQTAAVMLQQDSGREMVQITVTNPDMDGVYLRDLRLPPDVLILDVTRDSQSIVPSGYTRLALDDEVTLLGQLDSLGEAIVKLGF